MSAYEGPKPEMHVPLKGLDLKPYDQAWTVLKRCDSCVSMLSLPHRPPAEAWPDFCQDCTDYSSCDCQEGQYPVWHSWKSEIMWNGVNVEFFQNSEDGDSSYGSDQHTFVCEC